MQHLNLNIMEPFQAKLDNYVTIYKDSAGHISQIVPQITIIKLSNALNGSEGKSDAEHLVATPIARYPFY